MNLLDIGYDNFVSAGRIISIVSPDSLPVRRLIQDAKSINRVIDASCGKKTRAVIITDSDHIVLSAFTTAELCERMKS